MDNAVGRLTHALDASREEQGLCPHVKNPAFDAGMVFRYQKKIYPGSASLCISWRDMFKSRLDSVMIVNKMAGSSPKKYSQRDILYALQ